MSESILGIEQGGNKLGQNEQQQEFRFGLKQRLYNWNMRTAREAKGWRQADLANVAGVSTATISQIETLRQFPNPSRAEKIANALGRATEILFPEWLKVFKLERVTPSIEDRSISLEEAISKKLIAPAELIEEKIGWSETTDDIERRVELERLVPGALNSLTPREKRIIEFRFGLDKVCTVRNGHVISEVASQCARTLEEVGRMFNINKERTRQIEAKALRKLRHPSRSRELKDLLT